VSSPVAPTRILLVRHGGTTASDAGLFAGSSDVELSDAGRAQVARMADRLAQDLACLNVLEFRGPSDARLLLMNDTSHLAGHSR